MKTALYEENSPSQRRGDIKVISRWYQDIKISRYQPLLEEERSQERGWRWISKHADRHKNSLKIRWRSPNCCFLARFFIHFWRLFNTFWEHQYSKWNCNNLFPLWNFTNHWKMSKTYQIVIKKFVKQQRCGDLHCSISEHTVATVM